MKYTTRQIEEAANKLRALPAKKRAKKTSSKRAVQMLQAEFAALLDRGYTLEEAGRALHKAGIEVSPLTILESLNSLISAPRTRAARVKSSEEAPPPTPVKRTPAKRTSEPPSAPAKAIDTSTADSATMGPTTAEPASRKVAPPPIPALPPLSALRASLPPLPPLPKAQGAALSPPTRPSPGFLRGNLASAKATFQVRPDTPDSDL